MNKKFQKMSELTEDVYGISCVLEKYCTNLLQIEEIRILYPALKHLHKNIDNLNAMFINFDEGEL